MGLSYEDVAIRLLLATLFASIIGWEREFKSRPAGLRTHILVCLGATVIALIQKQIMFESLQIGIDNPDLRGIIRSDPARLICQIVSGIGFLGAGTIVITKSSIHGLTTAASLWTTAGLGIAIGMGYYPIAITGAVLLLFSLAIVKRIQSLPLPFLSTLKRIEVEYRHKETKEFIQSYFSDRQIKVRSTNFSIYFVQDSRMYTDDYTVELPKGITYTDIAEGLAENTNITQIHLVNL